MANDPISYARTTQVRLRRGTTAQIAANPPIEAEPFYDLTENRIGVGGTTEIIEQWKSQFLEHTADATDAVARNLQEKLTEVVSVKDFGAVGDGVTDDTLAIQKAVSYANSSNLTVFFPAGTFIVSETIFLFDGVRLCGESRASSQIIKNTNNATSSTIYAGALVVYPGTLPSMVNAVIALTGSGGRFTGSIENITLSGVFSNSSDKESQLVEFGIVSLGSCSDVDFVRVDVKNCQYGIILPDIFASRLTLTRVSNCLQAYGIDNGTSLSYVSNYANNCRDGHYIRSLKYSNISSNACDFTNSKTLYPTRSRTCFAYRFRSLIGCKIDSNGDENTFGRNIWLETLDNCTVKNNISIGIGSDYSGSDEIAWIYSDGVLRLCDVSSNGAYSVKSGGLIQGSANSAKHHNFYFESETFVLNSKFRNNLVRTAVSGSPVESGYGNNVPSSWVNATLSDGVCATFSPILTANVVGDLSVTYNSDNAHYIQQDGAFMNVFGKFDVTINYTTAASYLIFEGFPVNSGNLWVINISAVDGGSSLTKKMGAFRINANQNRGVVLDEDDGLFNITDIPTATTLQIFYSGRYLVG